MARKLTTYVWLREPGATVQTSFGPGDTLPEWAEKALEGKDHLFEKIDPAERAREVQLPAPRDRKAVDYTPRGTAVGTEPAATEEGNPDSEPVEDDDIETGDDTDADAGENSQPKGNASREAWREFAEENGVPVTKEMGRDDIKDACEAAGVVESD